MFGRATTDAGKSASDYYKSRLRDWHRSLRAPSAVALGFAALLAAPIWIYVPLGKFYAGMIVGSSWGMIAWIRDEPPEAIAKWKRGADGEKRTATVLRKLEKDGWYAVHDRAGALGNLDHIAVGPAGVFLLETKTLSGTVSVEKDELAAKYGPAAADRWSNRSIGRLMRRRAVMLKEQVQNVTDIPVFVQAVVVIWGDFPGSCIESDRVSYIAGEALEPWLRSHKSRLSARDTNFIRLALAADVVAPPAAPFGATA